MRLLRSRFVAEVVVLLCNKCNECVPNKANGALNWSEEEVAAHHMTEIACECGQRILIETPRRVPAFREYPQDPPVRTHQAP